MEPPQGLGERVKTPVKFSDVWELHKTESLPKRRGRDRKGKGWTHSPRRHFPDCVLILGMYRFINWEIGFSVYVCVHMNLCHVCMYAYVVCVHVCCMHVYIHVYMLHACVYACVCCMHMCVLNACVYTYVLYEGVCTCIDVYAICMCVECMCVHVWCMHACLVMNVCMCVIVCMHVCYMHVCGVFMCVHACVKTTSWCENLPLSCSNLFLVPGSLTGLTGQWLPVIHVPPPRSPTLELWTHHMQLLVRVKDPNSGFHTYKASDLPTKSPLQSQTGSY